MNFKKTTLAIGSFIVNLEGKSKLNYYLVHMKESLRENCPNTGKYGPEKSPYLDTFHAVYVYTIMWQNHDFIILSQSVLHSFLTITATHKNNQEKLKFSRIYFWDWANFNIFRGICFNTFFSFAKITRISIRQKFLSWWDAPLALRNLIKVTTRQFLAGFY